MAKAKTIAQKITKRIWSTMIITGALSIVFGLLALFWPGLTLAILISIVGVFAIVMGVVWFFDSISRIKTQRLWWIEMLVAIAVIALGVFLLVNPSAATQIFAIALAVFVFVQALLDFVSASYADDSGKVVWIITGILGTALGILLISRPSAAIIALLWVIGIYAIVRGILSIGFAFSIRGKVKR